MSKSPFEKYELGTLVRRAQPGTQGVDRQRPALLHCSVQTLSTCPSMSSGSAKHSSAQIKQTRYQGLGNKATRFKSRAPSLPMCSLKANSDHSSCGAPSLEGHNSHMVAPGRASVAVLSPGAQQRGRLSLAQALIRAGNMGRPGPSVVKQAHRGPKGLLCRSAGPRLPRETFHHACRPPKQGWCAMCPPEAAHSR